MGLLRSLSFIVFLFFPIISFAQEKLPDYNGWVNDFAGVISPEDKARINALIVELEARTSAEIFVVTVPSIAPYNEFEYAQMLFDKWKIGKKGKDNGVLVLLAVQQRRWRIQTGYGVEGILPDALCSQIGRNHLVPFFKEREYGQGLYYGVAAIADVISKDAGVTLTGLRGVNLKKRPQHVTVLMCFFAFFFFLLWNIPWPMFIGLTVTIIFGVGMYHISPILGYLVFCGYLSAMLLRYLIWFKSPVDARPSFWHVLFWGILTRTGNGSQGGNFNGGGGGFGGGGDGFSGGGGGSSGGGGAGGGF